MNFKFKDITGHRFGRLVAMYRSGTKQFPSGGSQSIWVFQCDCGGQVERMVPNRAASCGCWKREIFKLNQPKSHTSLWRTNTLRALERVWRIRSPNNVIHEFKNLQQWILSNPHLFDPEDVLWVKKRGRLHCLALKGLQQISPRTKHPRGSWHGWTWHSQTERLKNEGRDLLERNV